MASKFVEIKVYDHEGKLLNTKKTNCMFMVAKNVDTGEIDQSSFISCKGIDIANAYVAIMQTLAEIRSKYDIMPLVDNYFEEMSKAQKKNKTDKNKGKKVK